MPEISYISNSQIAKKQNVKKRYDDNEEDEYADQDDEEFYEMRKSRKSSKKAQ